MTWIGWITWLMVSGPHNEETTLCLQINVPCDCSILWMSETMTECPGNVTFNLDQMPCGAANWTAVPAEVAISYDCSAGELLFHFECQRIKIISKAER